MGSLTRNQLGFLALTSLLLSFPPQEGTVDLSSMIQMYLFSTAEHYLHIGIEEEVLLRNQEYLGYFREVIFARKTHFDGRDRLVQSTVVKSHRSLGIQPRLYLQMTPAHRKAGS